MFATDDTIVAIATPPGRAGLGIVRLSGREASGIARTLAGRSAAFAPRRATFAKIRAAGDLADHAVVTAFPAPRSYTGEDVVEISAHGTPVVLQAIVAAAIERGARLAEPGEFTLRAFLNGRISLVQAEAVADLIDATTPLQARAAFDQLEGTLTGSIAAIESRLFDLMARLEASLDFPDEGFHFVERCGAQREIERALLEVRALQSTAARGRLIREGAQIAVLGTPNVGKSSLFNALLATDRAIVTPVAGTTRDLLAERANLNGISVGLVDTAGIRESADPIEQEGIARARRVADVAELTIVVLDRSRPLSHDDRHLLAATAERHRLVVVNKIDLPASWTEAPEADRAPRVSAKTGEGLTLLVDAITEHLGADAPHRDAPLVTNLRHVGLLDRAGTALERARDLFATEDAASEEFLLADLQDAAASLQEITGRRTSEDLLGRIFERFCIGK